MRRLLLICGVVCSSCLAPVSEGGSGGGSAGGSAAAGGGTAGSGGGAAGAECAVDSDCNAGMVCESCGGSKSCAPGCRNDTGCQAGFTCQGGTACVSCPCASQFCAPNPCFDGDHDGFVAGTSSPCSSKAAGDCNDHNATVHPGATELCSDHVDNDCDGLIDSADSDCGTCKSGATCANSFDCNLGHTYCENNGGPNDGCCQMCPLFEGDCAIGFAPESAGVDVHGCPVTACVRTDLSCTAVYMPVCATNGQTYSNLCELNRAEATALHSGVCTRGENVGCRYGEFGSCGPSGDLYCRDACPACDSGAFTCTKVGVCSWALDCPAGLAPPPASCPNGQPMVPACVSNACSYSCP